MELLSVCEMGCCPIRESLNKTKEFFKMDSVELCVEQRGRKDYCEYSSGMMQKLGRKEELAHVGPSKLLPGVQIVCQQ